jgi:hypothetical protein
MVEREMALPFEYEKKYTHELDYRNKLVLAPMVRTGSCKLSRKVMQVTIADDQCLWYDTHIE